MVPRSSAGYGAVGVKTPFLRPVATGVRGLEQSRTSTTRTVTAGAVTGTASSGSLGGTGNFRLRAAGQWRCYAKKAKAAAAAAAEEDEEDYDFDDMDFSDLEGFGDDDDEFDFDEFDPTLTLDNNGRKISVSRRKQK